MQFIPVRLLTVLMLQSLPPLQLVNPHMTLVSDILDAFATFEVFVEFKTIEMGLNVGTLPWPTLSGVAVE